LPFVVYALIIGHQKGRALEKSANYPTVLF
jgi:hypothetical protein